MKNTGYSTTFSAAVLLLSCCSGPILDNTTPDRHVVGTQSVALLPDICSRPWQVPHQSSSVLTAEAASRALGPIYRAVQRAVK